MWKNNNLLLKEKEKEKYIYLNFFIRILYRNLHEWLAVNSRKYKPGVYTRGNLDKSKINRIINELEDNPVSSKRLYKILKKTVNNEILPIYKKYIQDNGLIESYGKNINEAVRKRDQIAFESFKYMQKKTEGLSF